MRIDRVESDGTYDWRRDGWLAACSLTALLLIIAALTPHAPGFDTFLRLFVFCIALVRGFAGFRKGGAWLPLSAAVIAILFNPLRPPNMSPTAWIWCDLIAAGWFATVGAWRLLRSWDPQRGWAAAALSLAAVAVPAIAALNMPNRDALNAATLDENLAVANDADNSVAATAGTKAPPQAAAADAPPETAAAKPGPAAQSNRSLALGIANAPAAAIHDPNEVSAETDATHKPAAAHESASPASQLLNDEPSTNEPGNDEPEGNEE